VLDAPRDVDDDALVQFDLLIVQDHRPLAGDDVIELVGARVVVQLGVLDLDAVDFASRPVLLLDEAADLAAGFCPRPHVGRVASQEAAGDAHGNTPRLIHPMVQVHGVGIGKELAPSY
jgi:hypothetical protein